MRPRTATIGTMERDTGIVASRAAQALGLHLKFASSANARSKHLEGIAKIIKSKNYGAKSAPVTLVADAARAAAP